MPLHNYIEELMEDQFDKAIIHLRKYHYQEKQHVKEMAIDGSSDKYKQFKHGKLFGISESIEKLIKLKNEYYKHTQITKV